MYIYGIQTHKHMAKVEKKSLLTLIELLPPVKRKPRMGRYRCECGNVIITREGEVIKLNTLSCGCYRSTLQRELHLKHGLAKHPLYGVWKAMIDRCHNPENKQFPDYGERGVQVCKEWREDFISFYNWAITNDWQKGLHLDKDTKGTGLLYAPDMCCFITRRKNNRAKRDTTMVVYNGETIALPELAEKLGMSNTLIRERMRRFGWDIIKAVTTPRGLSKFKKKQT